MKVKCRRQLKQVRRDLEYMGCVQFDCEMGMTSFEYRVVINPDAVEAEDLARMVTITAQKAVGGYVVKKEARELFFWIVIKMLQAFHAKYAADIPGLPGLAMAGGEDEPPSNVVYSVQDETELEIGEKLMKHLIDL